MEMTRRIAALEKQVAKLEKAAVKFEQHRQEWIDLNEGLKKMQKEDEKAAKARSGTRV